MAIGGLKQVFITHLDDVKSSDVEGVGTIRYANGKRYKWVQFSGTTAQAVGDVLCYTDATMTIADKANSSFGGAGVAMAANAASNVAYGWVQTGGVATLSTALGGTAANGNALTTTSATAGTLTKVAAATDIVCGYALAAATKVVSCAFPE